MSHDEATPELSRPLMPFALETQPVAGAFFKNIDLRESARIFSSPDANHFAHGRRRRSFGRYCFFAVDASI